jgi:imidazoleglycerol phosphate synthase glutamine amidotransferase subunit HisH
MIAIIDYGIGNLGSVHNMLQRKGGTVNYHFKCERYRKRIKLNFTDCCSL